jgi:hypothetical protein
MARLQGRAAAWHSAGLRDPRLLGGRRGRQRHGAEGSLKYRLTRELENRVVAAADAVITICHGLRDDLLARGVRGGKVGVVPNGVDLTLFGDPPPRDEALARKLGLAEGPVIGFIGSFYDYEGLDDLIDAMPLTSSNATRTRSCCSSAAGRSRRRCGRGRGFARRARSASPGACRTTRSSATIRCATSWPTRASAAA